MLRTHGCEGAILKGRWGDERHARVRLTAALFSVYIERGMA
jgi:hypothetical protein